MATKSSKDSKQRGAYFSWCDMRKRCFSTTHKDYKHYGGRGITVCSRWSEFKNFFSDMGEKPTGMTIERLDVNSNYSPENCKWIPKSEQGKNKRSNHKITFNGITKNLSEWAVEMGISPFGITYRLNAGWSVEKTFTTPLKRKPKC
jgi:hypothetical protein